MTDPVEAAYERLRRSRPELFENPPGAPIEILPAFPSEEGPYGVLYSDPYITLLRDPVRLFDGPVGGYFRVVPSAGHGGAAILPVYDGRVILVRHFRHSTRRWHWEIPRGFSEPGESLEETARRELEEELKVTAVDLRPLGLIHVDTGLTAGGSGLFWAAVDTPPNLEEAEEEGIERAILLTAAELGTMQEQGEITDSFTMGAVLNARQHRLPPFD
ncbi:NUDIX domain-containing protein [Actinomadura sp. DC4]|uniref:NUDIX hydrolase n=1 Tax=Actinomadura sp. DC4 TaxID=3055069 RepID=UPI0025B1625A|nr:NUDIX domain-containing protein [Actinomadura sp. DC4]MDN3359264.1 NUDIX domain-containing protein [Actinomadura sp. DC4]